MERGRGIQVGGEAEARTIMVYEHAMLILLPCMRIINSLSLSLHRIPVLNSLPGRLFLGRR